MRRVALPALLIAAVAALPAATLEVVVPKDESEHDRRFADVRALIDAALAATEAEDGPYRLRQAERPMTEARYVEEVQRPGRVNLIWTSTSEAKEEVLRPIRIPLRKGLLGLRVFLIDAERQAEISAITSLAQLRRLRVVQGLGWGDIGVFEANRLPVVTGPHYEHLFKLVVDRRVDYFSRGVTEVVGEWEARRQQLPQLAIERDLLLFYPWPYYCFTSRDDEALAARVERGLWRLIENGRFDAILREHHADALKQLKLGTRRVLRLDNPLLPPQTPLQDRRLWHQPGTWD